VDAYNHILIRYNAVNGEELRRYQEACLARETPSLTLAPRVRNSYTPGTDSNTDGEGSNSPSPISLGSSGGGSVQGRHAQITGSNELHVVRSNVNTASSTPRPGSSESGGSGESYCQRGASANASAMWQQYAPTAMSEPDPQVAKLNMNLSGQLGQSYGSRPSYKRLASQTLGPELIKRTAIAGGGEGGGGDGTDGYDGGGGDSGYEYEIPDPPPPILRKRSNSSPTSSNSRPTHMFNPVSFHALPSYSSSSGARAGTGNGAPRPPLHNSHLQMAQH
jgi:hypothetical protein